MKVLIVGGGIGGLSIARELALARYPVHGARTCAAAQPGRRRDHHESQRDGSARAQRARRPGAPPIRGRISRARRATGTGRLLAMRDYRPLYEERQASRRAHSCTARTCWMCFIAAFRQGRCASASTATEGLKPIPGDRRRRHSLGGAPPGSSATFSPARYMGYRSHRLIMENVAPVSTASPSTSAAASASAWCRSARSAFMSGRLTTRRAARSPALQICREQFAQFTDETMRKPVRRPAAPPRASSPPRSRSCGRRRLGARLGADGTGPCCWATRSHALTPNIGQGAGMAMEDAAVLAGNFRTSA